MEEEVHERVGDLGAAVLHEPRAIRTKANVRRRPPLVIQNVSLHISFFPFPWMLYVYRRGHLGKRADPFEFLMYSDMTRILGPYRL